MRDHGVNMLVKTSQGSFQPISDIVTSQILTLYSYTLSPHLFIEQVGLLMFYLSLLISVYFLLYMYCFVNVKIPVCMLKSTMTHCCHTQFFPLNYIIITRCHFTNIFSRYKEMLCFQNNIFFCRNNDICHKNDSFFRYNRNVTLCERTKWLSALLSQSWGSARCWSYEIHTMYLA